MRSKAMPHLAVRLLPLAIAGVLSQSAWADAHLPEGAPAAQALCPAPSVHPANMDIEIPCLLLKNPEGQMDQLRVVLSLVPEEPPYWTLSDFALNTCRPHLNACRTTVDLQNLNLIIPGVSLMNVSHYLTLTHTGEPGALTWDMPALSMSDPFTPSMLSVSLPVDTVTFPNNTQKPFDVGIGSGAFHAPNEPSNVFYTVTDRGPNIPCSGTLDIIGTADFCKDAQGAVDNNGKVFPVPGFTPTIYQFELDSTAPHGYQWRNSLTLKDALGHPISGTTNDLKMLDAAGQLTTLSNTENSYAADGSALPFNNNGLDTEALVKLNDGSFWLSEEYAPSLVHVAADGTIIERVVPAGVDTQLADAGYPVSGVLPKIFSKRRLNRGIESIAVSPDQQYLYFIMQSPLANPDGDAYKASRHVRLMKLSLKADGSIHQLEGEYVYELDIPQTFVADNSSKQNDVKVSEMVALETDDLVILERISAHTKLYRVTLDDMPTNILGTPWDDMGTTPSLENSTLMDVNITPVHKSLVLDSRKLEAQGITLSKKIEGIALLNNESMALINDNDFGIADDKSTIQVLKNYAPLVQQSGQRIKLKELGRYDTGVQGVSAAEIVAFHAPSQQGFFINASTSKVEMLDLSDPTQPSKKAELDVAADVLADNGFVAGGVNSVAVSKTQPIVAVAVQNADKQAHGVVAVYVINQDGSLSYSAQREVGALPDMVTFSPDGRFIVIANEGEPSDDYTNDPEGSISIVDLSTTDFAAKTADFSAFTAQMADLKAKGLRVFGNNGQSSLVQDLEPEYITVSGDSTTAYVGLQENNAIAVVDLNSATVTNILPLGFKDHSKPGNEIDASNKDDAIKFANYPVLGMYMPDSIASYEYEDETYIVTANEGDSRDYGGYSEEVRVKDLTLDATAYPNAADLQRDENLGRLKTTTANGDTDGDGDVDQIYAYGARSFSIWNSQGELVFDSGNDIGLITANKLGMNGFNDDEGESDGRSDDKGAEPEALTVGKIGDRTYAFVGLERTGGIMVYDITHPMQPYFVEYVRNPLDVAPEGMSFIQWEDSPNGQPLLMVGNEVSGTVTLYQIEVMEY